MRKLILTLLFATIAGTILVRPADAIPAFQKVFFAEYIEEHEDEEFVEMVSQKIDGHQVKCLICHQGKKRKHRNAYGQHLSELLDKKEDKKDTEKIIAALEEVGDLPFDPDDEESETFAERITAGKLPAADDVEDLMAAPPEGDGT